MKREPPSFNPDNLFGNLFEDSYGEPRCHFCKGHHPYEEECEEGKEARERMMRDHKERRRSSLEDPRDWPPESTLVKRWKAHGLECAIARGGASLCGYVKIPPNHPDANHHYDNVENINVHGGITFNTRATDGGMWFGFDCAHFGDWFGFGPEGECDMPDEFRHILEHPGRVWTVEDVQEETERMAAQFAEKITF